MHERTSGYEQQRTGSEYLLWVFSGGWSSLIHSGANIRYKTCWTWAA
ncbi:MAG: hypothetical protein AVDCRST_MAG31-2272 [uncultured Sphingomonas sp.]|uniref:Uncharacterized protein n=1 Tax=uncultured Sphingomonas sp. TaxID=158754 RepID=A0A6J4TQR0_9SPHN|nr:MAG: hypothetical protein AVDCRST_MAG31-2272 [uncultured Sphingomonas sp.]